MTPLGILVACAGNWRGTNILQDPNSSSPDESESTMVITPVLNGEFVRVDYTWSYQGTPQQGSLVLRTEERSGSSGEGAGEGGAQGRAEARLGAIRAHWMDSWHMGEKVMECRGENPDGRMVKLVGSWSPPSGPDWGWRIELGADDAERAETLRMVMYVVWPDGEKENLALEAVYARDAVAS